MAVNRREYGDVATVDRIGHRPRGSRIDGNVDLLVARADLGRKPMRISDRRDRQRDVTPSGGVGDIGVAGRGREVQHCVGRRNLDGDAVAAHSSAVPEALGVRLRRRPTQLPTGRLGTEMNDDLGRQPWVCFVRPEGCGDATTCATPPARIWRPGRRRLHAVCLPANDA